MQKMPRNRGEVVGWSVLTALVVVLATVSFSMQPAAAQNANPFNKTDVLRIGVLLPFNIPAPLELWANVGAFSIQCYLAMAWYADLLNRQNRILPNTRIQLVPANTMADRGLTLSSAQAVASQNVVAMVGELTSRNTATAALVASIQKILHCNPSATTTLLSNKADIVAGMMATLKSQNVTSFSVVAGDDEELSSQAKLRNITIQNFVQYTAGSPNYDKEMAAVVQGKTRTILTLGTFGDGVKLMQSSRRLNLFNGDYWLIASLGWDQGSFFTPEERATLREMHGMWQVGYKLPILNGGGELADLNNYYVSAAGPAGFYQVGNMSAPGSTASCDMTIPGARGCFGQGPGVIGVMNEYLRISGLKAPLRFEPWMIASAGCIRVIAQAVDFYMKNGTVTFADVAAKNLMTKAAANNITNLLNWMNADDFYGKKWTFDRGGDIRPELSIYNYRFFPELNTTQMVEVGIYDSASDVLTYKPTETLRFFANKTSVPQPPPIPTNQFQASMGLRFGLDAVVAVCALIVMALAIAMLLSLQKKIFKAASPMFLGICVTFVWLKYLGFAVVFGSLIVKTYRIFVIFTTKKRKGTQNLSDGVMFGYFSVLITIWIGLLLVWTFVPSLAPKIDYDRRFRVDETGSVASVDETPVCQLGGFNNVCLAAMVATLAMGVMLTYAVRGTPSAFNESKYMAYAIYNWVVIGVVLNAIANFAVSNPDIIFVMESLTVIITQTGVAILM
ncbi:hypothetical protein HDU96_001722, partial [Phlyctochytrium bullatum]